MDLFEGLGQSFANVTSLKVLNFELFLLIVFSSKWFHPQSLIYGRNTSLHGSSYTFLEIGNNLLVAQEIREKYAKHCVT